MIAVVVKADQPELFTLVRTIFHAWIEAGSEIDLDDPTDVWGQIEKFDLDGSFWQMGQTTFGYLEDNPSLKNFLLRLMLTDYAHHLKGDVPQSLRGLLLPRTGRSNAVVCLAQWRDSSSKVTSYDRLSAEAAALLKIEDHLPNLEIDRLADVMTFLVVEKRIASNLREWVQGTADTINAPRCAGHCQPPTVWALGFAHRGRFHGCPTAGTLRRLWCTRGGGGLLRPTEPVHERLRLPGCDQHVPGLRDGAVPLRPTLPALL